MAVVVIEREDPRAFGRYEVRRRLGAGGFGDVFVAWDPVLEREVAVKAPRDAWWSSEPVIEEARALARLEHPSIVAVLDAGREGRRAYIVLEHVKGRDLETLARRRRQPWSPEAALELIEGPARALDHAHARGILHRDVKPANLLVRTASPAAGSAADAPIVKVADFGLHALAARHGPTDTPAALGDPRYAAPEAWRGEPDPLSDVFSLAAVYFELVAGVVALPGVTPAEQLEAVLRPTRRRLRGVRPDLPAALDTALAGALSPRRHERPRTALDLVAALRASLTRHAETRRVVEEARARIQAREPAPRRACPSCGTPLHPRAESCPRCPPER